LGDQCTQQRTLLKGAGQNRKLLPSTYGETHKHYYRSHIVCNTYYHNFYSGYYHGKFITPKDALKEDAKGWLWVVTKPPLNLSALITSTYSSLGVSWESNPQPQLLEASVQPLSQAVDKLVEEENLPQNVAAGRYGTPGNQHIVGIVLTIGR
jgi:hypothetical protein